jgi:hypothetical protein
LRRLLHPPLQGFDLFLELFDRMRSQGALMV